MLQEQAETRLETLHEAAGQLLEFAKEQGKQYVLEMRLVDRDATMADTFRAAVVAHKAEIEAQAFTDPMFQKGYCAALDQVNQILMTVGKA